MDSFPPSPSPAESAPVVARGAGRYAPSPSGRLHIGNLRTGVLAWLCAHSTGRDFRWRVEDLDRVQAGAAEQQLADFAALGVTPDGPLIIQSERTELYGDVIDALAAAGFVYECYCSRRDIQSAPSAPHTPPGAYPGTCRNLTASVREAERTRLAGNGREPALRLDAQAAAQLLEVPVRASGPEVMVADALLGDVRGFIDDFVLRRGDGVDSYHLAVVVDDLAMGIDQVVRADDLASSTPRQVFFAWLLDRVSPELIGTKAGRAEIEWVHVPLVLGPSGQRLAKRDGAVTLGDLAGTGFDFFAWLGSSLGFGPWDGLAQARAEFDLTAMTRQPAVFDPADWTQPPG
ncbi:tRNA glutamyl-Q(34) synthetase GluQRS [Brevibacterium luteolum]|nr:tRNA glutamyl-Q(34) synthetase GluQRS [Brevibacterium luteolum]